MSSTPSSSVSATTEIVVANGMAASPDPAKVGRGLTSAGAAASATAAGVATAAGARKNASAAAAPVSGTSPWSSRKSIEKSPCMPAELAAMPAEVNVSRPELSPVFVQVQPFALATTPFWVPAVYAVAAAAVPKNV